MSMGYRCLFKIVTSFPLDIYCLFDDSLANRCERISHCGFDFHFPSLLEMLNTFSFTVGHLYVFVKVSVQPIFNWVIWIFLLMSGLYEFLIFFYINPLLDRWLTNIFSHSVGCLFILLIASFIMQKLFSLT